MKKLTEKQVENRLAKVRNKALTITERRAAHKEIMESLLNPKAEEEFDPTTFDPMDGVDDYEVKKRNRAMPPKKLPTMGLLPKQLFEGQMVGMFESKQDLYLLIALLWNRVSDLEDEVKTLKGG